MAVLEKEIERKLCEMVKRHGGRCLKWVCPGWAGVPDRIILLPHGLAMFAETKKPKGGKVAPLQIQWKKWLGELGFSHFFIFTESDIRGMEKIIESWEVISNG